MEKNSQNFSMQEALRLAQSDAGQQLLALLQRQDQGSLQQAARSAADGDYRSARETLAALLASREAQSLLKQLEE